ncbi:hypothetical protein RUMGNA_01621 [Mediterraneibacter gnavus ATCC 29149]|uniref:Uncharacterized protein n=1 Tax=Mediterraneibacter gnavus (strain ATCC 29149 / DSM 114966 / JCM 6515 / VPI C7-9) TaxID=411470 RepID=A7B245_MEDG7|nr:hypothetical protein RUMGNA_01621 [Mediterraneibacter gnavus ATCC 29149]
MKIICQNKMDYRHEHIQQMISEARKLFKQERQECK